MIRKTIARIKPMPMPISAEGGRLSCGRGGEDGAGERDAEEDAEDDGEGVA